MVTPTGEAEKYLFYRGVGKLRAPLRVVTDRQKNQLTLYAYFDEALVDEEVVIEKLWLTHIRSDGRAAVRELGPVTITADSSKFVIATSAHFEERQYAEDNLTKLKQAMHQQLVREGLYADEATAMLSTWERAYFKSAGLRLFFLVPRPWTDHYLPLSIFNRSENRPTPKSAIERVMMGRIELITPKQRRLLKKLAEGPVSDGKWIDEIPKSPARDRFLVGRTNFGDLKVQIPPDYHWYLSLGRFRNALVVAEAAQRPTPALRQFIKTYALHPFQWQTRETPGKLK